ncbi:MAG: hypothetical protein R8J84_06895, partial [Mariprofundales bacterium]
MRDDSNGSVNTGIITVPAAGAALNTLTVAGGLTATGPYTVIGAAGVTNAGVTLAAGSSVTNPETAIIGVVGTGSTLPTTLFTGTSFSGTTAVGTANLVFPIGALKDSLGATNSSAITLTAGNTTQALDAAAALAGLSNTGPYTLTTTLASGGSTLTIGTVT